MSRRYYMVNGLFMFVKSVLSSWCFAFAVLLVSVTLNSRFCKYAVSFTATSLCHLSFGYDGAVVLDYHICQINVEFRWTIIQIFPDVIYADWWWHMEWLSRQVKLAPWFLFFFCFLFLRGCPWFLLSQIRLFGRIFVRWTGRLVAYMNSLKLWCPKCYVLKIL